MVMVAANQSSDGVECSLMDKIVKVYRSQEVLNE